MLSLLKSQNLFFVVCCCFAAVIAASFTLATPIVDFKTLVKPKYFLKSHEELKSAVAPPAGVAGSFSLIYETPWQTAYLHFNADNKGWNSVPGQKMSCISNYTAKYPCPSQYKMITVWGNDVVFVTTNGAGQWDNDHGQNYHTSSPGVWLLQDGKLSQLSSAPAGCPEQCNGHGQCQATTFSCTCDQGYYGPACSFKCPSSCTQNNHEMCSNQNGACVCQPGWAKCNGQTACMTNTSSDISNCGSCGNNCNNQPNIVSTSCQNGKCQPVCKSGFQNCDDGSCRTSCPLPGCNHYQLNSCTGNQINTSTNFTNNNWQTPERGTADYIPSYQDFAHLKGHLTYRYASDRKSVKVTFLPVTKDPTAVVTCSFAGGAYGPCTYSAAAPQPGPVSYKVKAVASNGKTYSLQPDDFDFIWDFPEINHGANAAGDYRNGKKGAIVELFGWRYNSIAKECQFLGKAGYLAAKIWPPNENLMSIEPMNNVMNPWWFFYQPVSHRLNGRLGTRDELRAMVKTCRSYGVRIYADSVTNHQTGSGNDGNMHHRNDAGGNCAYWPRKNTSADYPPRNIINGSSPMFTQGYTFEPADNSNLPPMQEFPAVPYGPEDFHCNRPLNSWNSPLDLNAGWLTGLVDVNTERENVQERIADYYSDMMSIGISGFRVDAAKHMRPPDQAQIFAKLKRNLGGNFPSDLNFYLEVLLGGEASLLLANPNSPYSFSVGFEKNLQAVGLTASEIDSIKIWYSAYPNDWTEDGGQLSPSRKVIQNDDADQQNPGSTSRDMHGKGEILVIQKNIPLHRQFEIDLFKNPFGVPDNDNDAPIRNVLSSFWLPANMNNYGMPDGFSNCSICGYNCGGCDPAQDMPHYEAYEAGAGGYTGNFEAGKVTRVHRDNQIINAMRGWMHLPPINTADFGNI